MCAGCEQMVTGGLGLGTTSIAAPPRTLTLAMMQQTISQLRQIERDGDPEPLPRADLVLADIIGWRIWRVTGSAYLRSLTAEAIWLPGEPMEAAEVADYGVGSNGVHVFKDKPAALREMTTYLDGRHGGPCPSYALGSVLLWGDVVEHERGYRAERAKIVSIDDVVWEGKPPWAEETKRALAFLRERYLPPPGAAEC